jgi:transcriptional regulator with XRE-family HTH domain
MRNVKGTPLSDLERLLFDNPEFAERAAANEPMAQIAAAVLELRARKGQTQKEFAKSIGIAESQVSELENAVLNGISLQTLLKIARGCGVELGFIFTPTSCFAGRFKCIVSKEPSISASDLAAKMTVFQDLQPEFGLSV